MELCTTKPGCGCHVMEALPRGNGWKLMTTGVAAKAQVLDSCLLILMYSYVCEVGECIGERFGQVRCDVGRDESSSAQHRKSSSSVSSTPCDTEWSTALYRLSLTPRRRNASIRCLSPEVAKAHHAREA